MTRAHKKQLAENLEKARAAKARKQREREEERNSRFIQPLKELDMAERPEYADRKRFPSIDVLPDDDFNPKQFIHDRVRFWVQREIEAALKELLP